jgi:hypothetical protein
MNGYHFVYVGVFGDTYLVSADRYASEDDFVRDRKGAVAPVAAFRNRMDAHGYMSKLSALVYS